MRTIFNSLRLAYFEDLAKDPEVNNFINPDTYVFHMGDDPEVIGQALSRLYGEMVSTSGFSLTKLLDPAKVDKKAFEGRSYINRPDAVFLDNGNGPYPNILNRECYYAEPDEKNMEFVINVPAKTIRWQLKNDTL